MKKIEFGDLLERCSVLQRGIIVHGCNAQGVMGSGIAVQVKQRWLDCFKKYSDFIANTPSPLGQVCFYSVPDREKLMVANAITQDNFGRTGSKYVSYKAVYNCFKEVANIAEREDLPVHYPLIGAGLGGGDWAIISDIIESIMAEHPSVVHTLWIYE